MASRPAVLPETYSGEGSFSEWADHFESVAEVNGWDAAAKALWLRVRLVGRAQAAFKRLSDTDRADYSKAKAQLKERFEPGSKCALYEAELRLDAQLAFCDRQKKPKTISEAVASTQELESYRLAPHNAAPSQQPPSGDPSFVDAVQTKRKVLGHAEFPLQLGQVVFYHDTIAADDLTADELLGLDFLQAHGCKVDAVTSTLLCTDVGLTLKMFTSISESNPSQYSVALVDTVRIPPSSELEVMVRVPETLSNGCYLMEPIPSKRVPVRAARALISRTPSVGRAPARLLNPDTEAITLRKGTNVATLEQCDECTVNTEGQTDPPPDMVQSLSPRKQALLWQMVQDSESNLTEEQTARPTTPPGSGAGHSAVSQTGDSTPKLSSPQPSCPRVAPHQIGEHLELTNADDVVTQPAPIPPQYPTRSRRPPDRFET